MFKFMKSKKGFSLVELMIVVVIMAILVAVAVPIFNSVTGNARAKTCIDNQRQIISNIGNLYLVQGISGKTTGTGNNVTPATVTFYVNDNGFVTADGGNEEITDATVNVISDDIDAIDIKGAFQTLPVCGDDTQSIAITLTSNTSGGTVKVTTSCDGGDDKNPHTLDTVSAS